MSAGSGSVGRADSIACPNRPTPGLLMPIHAERADSGFILLARLGDVAFGGCQRNQDQGRVVGQMSDPIQDCRESDEVACPDLPLPR